MRGLLRTQDNGGPMKRLLMISLLAALLGGAGLANAAGDPDSGKILAYTCTGCHGIPGYKNAYPSYHVPKIGGQNYDYIVLALKAYRSGERDHGTMNAQAAAMSDQDIEDIAAYFVSLSEGSN